MPAAGSSSGGRLLRVLGAVRGSAAAAAAALQPARLAAQTQMSNAICSSAAAPTSTLPAAAGTACSGGGDTVYGSTASTTKRRSWLAWAVAGAAAVAGGAAATGAYADSNRSSGASNSGRGGTEAAASAAGAATAARSAQDDQETMLLRLHEWLAQQGADIDKVEIRASQAGLGAGLGVFTRVPATTKRRAWWLRWLPGGGPAQPPALAAFPLSCAITADTVCADPQLGQQFSWMLDKQLLDERTAVMVYLLIERLRGDASRYAPYIQALPESFETPLSYSDAELQELRGTTLAKAAASMARRLQSTWSRIEPALAAMARDLGLPRRPTLDDFVWAHGVFWSRGLAVPVPETGAASASLAARPGAVRVLEGLVPGLDFCNHRVVPQCWWEVVAPPKAQQAQGPAAGAARSSSSSSLSTATSGHMVRLQLYDKMSDGSPGRVFPGEELFISYGDRANDQLLMLYGFALEHNPHDFLMLACPLPPQQEWDDIMHARMELLQAYGLRPQFFLPQPEVAASAAAAAAGEASSSKQQQPRRGDSSSGSASDGYVPLGLPGDVIDTLEVFMLNFQELATRRQALQEDMEARKEARTAGRPRAAPSQHSPLLDLRQLAAQARGMGLPELRTQLQHAGLRMATISTLVRLMEVKVTELEGEEEGTGPVEQDEQELARLQAEQSRLELEQRAGGSGAAAGTPAAAAALAIRRRHAAVVYRLGQKRLAREWLVRARRELQELLRVMGAMQERQAALERQEHKQ